MKKLLSATKNIRVLLLLLLIFVTTTLFAEGNGGMMMFEYQIGVTAPSMSEFIDEPSFLGFNFEGAYKLTDWFMVGGSVGWNEFTKTIERRKVTTPNGGYYAKEWRRVDVTPLLLKGTMFYDSETPFVPYLSVGVGPWFLRERYILGPLSKDLSSVNFGIRPELGTYLYWDPIGIRISAAFNGIIDNTDEIEDVAHWTFNIGIVFAQF